MLSLFLIVLSSVAYVLFAVEHTINANKAAILLDAGETLSMSGVCQRSDCFSVYIQKYNKNI